MEELEPDIELLDLDEGEMGILMELENDLTSSTAFELSKRVLRVSPELTAEINSTPYTSTPE